MILALDNHGRPCSMPHSFCGPGSCKCRERMNMVVGQSYGHADHMKAWLQRLDERDGEAATNANLRKWVQGELGT